MHALRGEYSQNGISEAVTVGWPARAAIPASSCPAKPLSRAGCPVSAPWRRHSLCPPTCRPDAIRSPSAS